MTSAVKDTPSQSEERVGEKIPRAESRLRRSAKDRKASGVFGVRSVRKGPGCSESEDRNPMARAFSLSQCRVHKGT